MPAPIPGPDGLWDIDTVSKRLGTTIRHIRRMVQERRMPYIKLGGLLRFDPVEIEAWINDRRRPPAA